MITDKGRVAQLRRNCTTRVRAIRHDMGSRRRFGREAPLYAERLWVRTSHVRCALKYWSSKQSAKVVNEWPNELIRSLEDWLTVRACLDHWVRGVAWNETGLIDQMMRWIAENGKVDRLSSRAEILRRYEVLDRIYETVCQEGRLRTRAELAPGTFREEGGVLIHVGPQGEPFFGGKGNHRLAMAIAAGLEYFPAQLGVVHSSGVGCLSEFRHDPSDFH